MSHSQRQTLSTLLALIRSAPAGVDIVAHAYYYCEFGPRWREQVHGKQNAPSSVDAFFAEYQPELGPQLSLFAASQEAA